MGGSPDRVARGLPTGGQGSKVYVLCAEPKKFKHKHFRPGTRPGGSVTGVTEKLFRCQMFMCLFRPLIFQFLGMLVIFTREVPNGVGADGVGVKFPIFPVNCSRLPLSQERIGEKRRKTKKSEEKRRKTKKSEEKRKKWENPSDPIYTNPIKNLPIYRCRLQLGARLRGRMATQHSRIRVLRRFWGGFKHFG